MRDANIRASAALPESPAAAVAGRLGRVDPEMGGVTEVELEGVSGGGPHLLAVLGSELWFTSLSTSSAAASGCR